MPFDFFFDFFFCFVSGFSDFSVDDTSAALSSVETSEAGVSAPSLTSVSILEMDDFCSTCEYFLCRLICMASFGFFLSLTFAFEPKIPPIRLPALLKKLKPPSKSSSSSSPPTAPPKFFVATKRIIFVKN